MVEWKDIEKTKWKDIEKTKWKDVERVKFKEGDEVRYIDGVMKVIGLKSKEQVGEAKFRGPLRGDSLLVGCRRWNTEHRGWEVVWIWEDELELAKGERTPKVTVDRPKVI